MAQIRLVASTYQVGHSSYMTVTNVANAYTDTDSSTYATIKNRRTTQYYFYLRGFNFNDVPSDATVNSFTIKVKAYRNSSNTSTASTITITNGTTALSGNGGPLTTSVNTYTITGITDSWNTIKNYGDNFSVRLSTQSTKQNTNAEYYIYGVEILVDYSLPSSDTMYIKQNGNWVSLNKVYKKVGGTWTEQTDLSNLFTNGTIYVNK